MTDLMKREIVRKYAHGVLGKLFLLYSIDHNKKDDMIFICIKLIPLSYVHLGFTQILRHLPKLSFLGPVVSSPFRLNGVLSKKKVLTHSVND